MATSRPNTSSRREAHAEADHSLQSSELVEKLTYSRPEDPVVRDARLEQERADAQLRRWKERIRFLVTVGLMLIIGGGCVWILFDPSFSPDDKKWAMGLLGLIIGRIIVNLEGKETK